MVVETFTLCHRFTLSSEVPKQGSWSFLVVPATNSFKILERHYWAIFVTFPTGIDFESVDYKILLFWSFVIKQIGSILVCTPWQAVLSLPCKPIRVELICFVRVFKTMKIHHQQEEGIKKLTARKSLFFTFEVLRGICLHQHICHFPPPPPWNWVAVKSECANLRSFRVTRCRGWGGEIFRHLFDFCWDDLGSI